MNIKRLIRLGGLGLALAACASTPPDTRFLDAAVAAITTAEAAGAVEHAPLEIRFAREKLAGARLAVADRNFDRARRLARQSLVNSELSVAKSAAARARETTRAQRESNADLTRELDPDGGEG